MTDASDPRAQLQYQVRFAWGSAGERELAGADLLVVADELVDADAPAAPGTATMATASAVAQRVLDAQTERGGRVAVGVVARGRADVSFAVEDLLAAGAVIDALAEVGIDHCSPEAAAAAAAYTGLRRATGHLVSASVTARLMRESAVRA